MVSTTIEIDHLSHTNSNHRTAVTHPGAFVILLDRVLQLRDKRLTGLLRGLLEGGRHERPGRLLLLGGPVEHYRRQDHVLCSLKKKKKKKKKNKRTPIGQQTGE